MSGSYEKINYSLRPAKHVERKMLIETFRNLSDFGSIESYRYVGFGSIYFRDFYLVHKMLGIDKMISIEHDKDKKERFLFNSPFKCIKLIFGESAEELEKLSWNQRTILWLDYDGKLSESVLSDINCFCTNAQMGSLIIISINAHTSPQAYEPKDVNQHYETMLDKLKENIGESNVPHDIKGMDLRGWGTAEVYRRIIQNFILTALSNRNAGREENNQILYKQLYNFNYSDGAKMLTTGGIIYDQGQQHLINKAMFEDRFDFVKTQEEPYKIEIPNLTYREIRYLDSHLPMRDIESIKRHNIPKSDLTRYSKLYRYFPTFAEMDV